jgi:hypothetical protein
LLHQVGDLVELNVKLRCQKVKDLISEELKSLAAMHMSSFKSVPVYGVNIYVVWHKMCDN